MTELQRAVSGLEKDLKKTRSKFESMVEFNDQFKQNLAIAREDLVAHRRDLAVARERVELLELRDEAHAEDQLVIDELRKELASLSFAVSERYEQIRRLKNFSGQTPADSSEKIAHISLSEDFDSRTLVRAASI